MSCVEPPVLLGDSHIDRVEFVCLDSSRTKTMTKKDLPDTVPDALLPVGSNDSQVFVGWFV